jgi:hypothetical protein
MFKKRLWVGGAAAALTAGVLTISSLDATAATRSFYVDCSSGADTNSGTSQSSAWKSLGAVSSRTFTAGDQIMLARGCTFDGGATLKGSGSSNARIVLTAFGTGNAPRISNSKGSTYSNGLDVQASFATVENVRVANASNAGIGVSGGNAVVRNVEITNTGLGVEFTGSGPALADKVDVHDLKIVVNTQGGADDYGAVGFVVQAPNVEIANSSCTNCQAPSYDFEIDGGFVEVWNNGNNLYVHHNRTKNVNGFMEVGGNGQGQGANNMRIENNVIVDTSNLINIHTSGQFQLAASALSFKNNTVYQSKKPFQSMFYSAGAATVTGNIFASAVALDTGGAPGSHTNNVYWSSAGQSGIYSLGTNERFVDPQFTNVSGGNFQLKASTPAKGLGAQGQTSGGTSAPEPSTPGSTPPSSKPTTTTVKATPAGPKLTLGVEAQRLSWPVG